MITVTDIEKLAELARIEVAPEEKKAFVAGTDDRRYSNDREGIQCYSA